MTINLQMPDIRELKPHITVFGVGGAGGNAVNNMIEGGLQGCDFVVANTDAQALSSAKAERIIAFRQKHGAFKRVADLRRVKGFGRKTLKKLEPFLDIKGETTLTAPSD